MEQMFQKPLEQNWWILGGRYVRLIELRNLTEQEIVDLLLDEAEDRGSYERRDHAPARDDQVQFEAERVTGLILGRVRPRWLP